MAFLNIKKKNSASGSKSTPRSSSSPSSKGSFFSRLSALSSEDLSTKDKAIPSITLLLIIFAAYVFLRPALATISENRSQLDTALEQVEKLESKQQFLQDLQGTTAQEQLDRRLSNMELYVPSIKPSLQTLRHISRLARLRDIQFSGLSLDPGTVKTSIAEEEALLRAGEEGVIDQGFSNFDVQFSINGRKSDLLDFVSRLNEISPLMKVEFFSTSIADTQTEGAQGFDVTSLSQDILMSASLRLAVYYKDIPASLPAVDDVSSLILTDGEEAFLNQLESYLFLDESFVDAGDVIIGAPLGKSNPFENTLDTPVLLSLTPISSPSAQVPTGELAQ
jgi:hypothetical protein